jgi:predicted aspartyl protease
MKIAQLLAAGLVLSTSALIAQPTVMESDIGTPGAVDGETVTDEVAIRSDATRRMTVDVSVAGQGPYRFLVDTGSERTIISRQLARRLQLESGKNTVLHSVIGINDVRTVNIPRLQVSNRTMSVANAPALEAANIGADGMLGIDSLRSQKVLFDFKAGTMAISPANRSAEPYDKDVIVVRARARKGRLIFTHARVDGQKVTVIIDTGSQVTIGNLALERAMVKRRAWIAPEPLTIQSVTGETMVANVAMLKELQLGSGVGLHKLPVAFADAHIFRKLDLEDQPALLLGMNAMRAFDRISIDFASKKVRFVLPATGMRGDLQMAERRRL